MDPEFARLVESTLGHVLARRGFQEVRVGYYPDAFGDAFMTYDSSQFRLKIYKDRHQVFVDVGPRGGDLASLSAAGKVLRFLGVSADDEDLRGTAAAIDENYEALSGIFSTQESFETFYPAFVEFCKKTHRVNSSTN